MWLVCPKRTMPRQRPGPLDSRRVASPALARREQLDYASFLEIILSDEVNRRAHRRTELRLQGAGFEETCRLEDFDWSAAITLDRRLLDAVFSEAGVPGQARARPAGGTRRGRQELPGPGPGIRRRQVRAYGPLHSRRQLL